MGNKILKWAAVVLGVVVGIVVIGGLIAFFASEGEINQDFEVETANLTIPTDEDSIQEGERLVAIRGCAVCHGDNLGGKQFINDPFLGTFYTENLTAGEGSPVADYSAEDWDRAIRHGIGTDGKPLLVMPSDDYNGICDEDLVKMIAYLQTLSEVDQEWPEISVGPLGRGLIAAGPFDLAAEIIDHESPHPASVVREVSAEYGGYLATTCTRCHGDDFRGGPQLGAETGDPPAANLTPAGHLANWNQEEFINTLRTGQTPEGKKLDPNYMPWPIATRMTDDELAAIWLYISALPAVERG